MHPGRLNLVLVLAVLAVLAVASAAGPAAASARPGLTDAVWTVHGHSASAAASINVLTLNDQRRIDNRVSAYMSSSGRLVLTAPEGLGDPDGDGPSCGLDNAKAGETSATEASCAAGYIGAIVGDLSGGSDTFDADPSIDVMIGAVIDGQQRPLSGGPGRDRSVGGALSDLLDGGGGPDSIAGGGGIDLLVGGPGADNLSGGAGNDSLLGGWGPDKLSGGAGRDICRGAGGIDTAKGCELARSIP
jgi:RTX calcium-binding nonapeptide repeat (4 copies)